MLTINNTLDGYLKDVEIKGNTIQDASNLADIRSVGDKVEGQELYEIPVLSVGKNLFKRLAHNYYGGITIEKDDGNEVLYKTTSWNTGVKLLINSRCLKLNTQYTLSWENVASGSGLEGIYFSDNNFSSSKLITMNRTFSISSYKNDFITIFMKNGSITSTSGFKNIQLEEGTVATPYEPYQEDKLTILSPVQLEKVGDVRDRIVCKDGVWGVEKWIKTILLKGGDDEGFGLNGVLDNGAYQFTWFANMGATSHKNSEVISSTMNSHVVSAEKYSSNIWIYDGVTFVIHHPTISTAIELKLWLQANPTIVKFALNTPQFIPLPHDQQIKLRTFANKTNISFLTEIEGTIKAQVPKSLGATVNTHTEQISNLNKELDRVKKLEESTVSTVTTESDFTTVEATSNGYFEDVKLEGKTLVNIHPKDTPVFSASDKTNPKYNIITKENYIKVTGSDLEATNYRYVKMGKLNFEMFKPNTTYTLVFTKLKGIHKIALQNGDSKYSLIKSTVDTQDDKLLYTVVTKEALVKSEQILYLWLNSSLPTVDLEVENPMIFEGDLTANPPSGYIEGLKSVGQSATTSEDVTDEIVVSSNNNQPKQIETTDDNSIKTTIDNPNYQSDKKRLLYYNDETQSWEKPVLREWDSIEKHADGKYYYHKRSEQVVLDGSENWGEYSKTSAMLNHSRARVFIDDCAKVSDVPSITNRFIFASNDLDYEHFKFKYYEKNNHGYFWIYVNDSKLATLDNNGFKQYVRNNPITVVYQLAEEKVYECTNIDLITYANETNYVVSSGAIVPRSTLKVHNNISNVVSLLQKKVSLLESNVTNYMITQNRLMLSSTYSADSVTFKVDYFAEKSVSSYDNDLFNLILSNILVGKENYDYDKMFNIIMDYASWSQISWDQFDILVEMMDLQHNPPIELPTEEFPEETPEE